MQADYTAAGAINCAGRLLDLSRPRVMGILNITPDSFSDGGQLLADGHPSLDRILGRAAQMVADGVDILDVGGESTRPGASPVSLQEEQDRVLPVVERLVREFSVPVSVDTSAPELMLAAAAAGAGLINDVRALSRPGATEAAAATGLPVCLMHTPAEPAEMQEAAHYDDVVAEVMTYLARRVTACTAKGIARRNILLDPGFGFGKRVPHNLALLHRLDRVGKLGFPLLVGLSRKSLIGHVTGRAVAERLAGSVVLATIAMMQGAAVVRVHDVRETVDAARICAAVKAERVV